MADPIAALIAARQAATAGPVFLQGKRSDYSAAYIYSVVDQSAESPYHSVAQQLAGQYGIGLLFEALAATDADRRYVQAAYDPALIPALEALQAERDALRALGAAWCPLNRKELLLVVQRLAPTPSDWAERNQIERTARGLCQGERDDGLIELVTRGLLEQERIAPEVWTARYRLTPLGIQLLEADDVRRTWALLGEGAIDG